MSFGAAPMPITQSEIADTHEIIAPFLRVTPVVVTDGREFDLGAFPLILKLELLQFAGSFKSRGAFANLLTRAVPPAGVVAASGGNHGVAVAYAARQVGTPARIYVPSVASPAKVERIRSFGADLHTVGDTYADALAASEAWASESGALPVHAFDQRETVRGQGSLAREMQRQAGDLDTVLVAVGGGGLISGVAAWYGGTVRVIGVEPQAAPTLSMAWTAGGPVDAPAGGIAADSLAPRRVGDLTFAIARRFVERVLLVDDEAIVRAQRILWRELRIVAEPGGAAAFAALTSGAYRPAEGERVAVIVCGGNTDAVTLGPVEERKSPDPR
jgi:threonine dehydratase